MEAFIYVVGSLIVAIAAYAVWKDEEEKPTLLEKIYIVFFISASWNTLTAIFILIVLNIIGHIFTNKEYEG